MNFILIPLRNFQEKVRVFVSLLGGLTSAHLSIHNQYSVGRVPLMSHICNHPKKYILRTGIEIRISKDVKKTHQKFLQVIQKLTKYTDPFKTVDISTV